LQDYTPKYNFTIKSDEGILLEENILTIEKDTCKIPVEVLLQKSLSIHILQQYKHVTSYLNDLLFKNCNLIDHLAALRAFYLAECGDIIHHFSTKIFQKV
jgi:hypothetical protein